MPFPANHRLRLGRFSEPGRLYSLTTTVHLRAPALLDLRAARAVVGQMRLVEQEGVARSLAWVVMPDHVHWLVELQRGTLGGLMGRFKSRSAKAVNALSGREGRFWQSGFYDRAVRREDDIRAIARYIIANPIRAGLVQRAGDYPHWDAVWL